MLRSLVSFLALDWLSSLPCLCSRSSAYLPTCHSWHLLEPSHSESTKPSCRLFRRHPKDTLSSELKTRRETFLRDLSLLLLIFREFLDIDLTLSPEKIQQVAGVAVTHINAYIAELRRLFLVEDLVDSLKFALLLWLMTYIGAIFNGMTVVILGELDNPIWHLKHWHLMNNLRLDSFENSKSFVATSLINFNQFQHTSLCSLSQKSTRPTSRTSINT